LPGPMVLRIVGIEKQDGSLGGTIISSPARPDSVPPRGWARFYVRALRLRCPACGGGPVFVSWFRMCPSCPACGVHFDREPEGGYWVGSYTINLMTTEAALVVVFLGVLGLTWPAPPWDLLLDAEVLAALIVPVLVFPFSKTLFIAIDLTFRPEEPEDHTSPHEAGLNSQRDRR